MTEAAATDPPAPRRPGVVPVGELVAQATATAIQKAGVVGAGGGGFPSHVKASAAADTVLANGAECEPLMRADSELMTREPERVLRGLALVGDAVGASRIVVALKEKNLAAVQAMRSSLPADGGIELLILSNVYPAGDEFLLVYEATGRVVPEGGIPLDVGVVVQNVTTLAQIADAVEGTPVTRKLVTVQGEVASPCTVDVPIGTPFQEVIDAAGGAILEDYAVVAGGPMMGSLAADLSEPVTKPLSGLIVLPREHPLVGSKAARQEQVLRLARAACCQCMACTELCPRYLLGHDLMPHRTVRAVQYSDIPENHEHITSAFLCCECGMCELFACPLGIQPRKILADLKAELTRRGVANPHVRDDVSADDVREYRQIPSSRLVQRLGLAEYNGAAPLKKEPLAPARVVLRMKQHVGAPAVPCVVEGQKVLEGDVVGEMPQEGLSARVHASIAGTVASVSSEEVVITAGQVGPAHAGGEKQ